jgi:hypothetical protein
MPASSIFRGRVGTLMEDRITYHMRSFVPRGKCTVIQRKNGHDVNEYDGYDYGTHFVLVPRRRIIPSTVPIKRHEVDIHLIRRDF